MAPKNSANLYRVQVLDRALATIDVIEKARFDLSLVEISREMSLPKSTAHRLLNTLESHRYVEKNSTGKYRLGLRLFELGSKAISHLGLRERAGSYLERLAYETGETAHLCILDEGEVLYLEKVEASRTVRAPSTVGSRYPAHCGGSGKALLAYLDEEELDKLVKKRGLKGFTGNTITTPTQLKEQLRLVVERGYAVDNEEFEEGLRCIGAPVRDSSGKVVAAVSIAGPAFRLSEDKVVSLARVVVGVTDKLSSELGYQKPALVEPSSNLSEYAKAVA